MGCHSSKQVRRDLILSPKPQSRSKSLPDNNHIVSLTSSTLGSLNVDATTTREEEKRQNDGDGGKSKDIFVELADARAWSNTIDRKIPRTPTETPPNEPEPIDALELMAGLHGDYSPLDRRSFSFYPINHYSPIIEPDPISDSSSYSSSNGDADEIEQSQQRSIQSDGINETQKDNAVVFYFTSLRGIRKTHDDCLSVREILKEYNVRIDERDVSMHSQFKEELKEMSREGMSIPKVFVDGKDLGGAEEVKRMHEAGELAMVFGKYGNDLREKGETGEECEACGDVRFAVCGHCSGSCRVFIDGDKGEGEEAVSVGGSGWQRCSDCNENGIVRCPVCC